MGYVKIKTNKQAMFILKDIKLRFREPKNRNVSGGDCTMSEMVMQGNDRDRVAVIVVNSKSHQLDSNLSQIYLFICFIYFYFLIFHWLNNHMMQLKFQAPPMTHHSAPPPKTVYIMAEINIFWGGWEDSCINGMTNISWSLVLFSIQYFSSPVPTVIFSSACRESPPPHGRDESSHGGREAKTQSRIRETFKSAQRGSALSQH